VLLAIASLRTTLPTPEHRHAGPQSKAEPASGGGQGAWRNSARGIQNDLSAAGHTFDGANLHTHLTIRARSFTAPAYADPAPFSFSVVTTQS
jgi:hypothetical protein